LLFLWLTWLVAAAVNAYAPACFAAGGKLLRSGFWVLWLSLWAALNATFVAADLFNLYVTLELITITAVPLAALSGGRAPLSASMRYLLFALMGSLAYLLGVVLIYGEYGRLDLYGLGAEIVPSAPSALAAGLITVGLMAKAALFPLHSWLPAAHARAPGPVSAILSALVVKAAVYLVLRLWWWTFPALHTSTVVLVLGVAGAAAMLYGSVQALVQVRLKRVVAYSTVAQLGYLLLVFPLASVAAWQGVVYHGLAHGLAKAALFLAAGNVVYVMGHDRLAALRGLTQGPLMLSLFAFALGSVSLMGLPPTGGFLGKWLLIRAALSQQAWLWAALVLLAGLLAAAYLFRVMALLFRQAPGGNAPDARRPLPAVMSLAPLVLALAAVAMAFGSAPLLALIESHSPLPEFER
jgi:multicomponent Na+:H+ antiporter subunit D